MIENGVSNISYFRTDGGSSKLYTQEYVDERDKEIERLNNIISKVKVDVNNMKEIIREQPSEDEDTDAWIQVRLSGLLYIIEGSDKE